MRKILFLILIVLLPAIAFGAKDKKSKPEAAAPPPPSSADAAAAPVTTEEFESQLKYQRGRIVLKDGLATLNVPENFRYLPPDQADLILVQAWGNVPGEKTLGMIFPSDISPLSEGGWGVVITYDEDGFVKDDDAETIDYNELLRQMKEGAAEANQEREKQGYPALEMIGWAAPPYYDKATHKLYWAKELKFGDDLEHTLNYNIRALGRRGVLVLNAVAAMDQLPSVQKDMQQVLGFVEFNEGHRYADFNPRADKVAAYGLAALVVGKVAAKAGLFKLIVGFILAGKKFVIVGLLALAGLLKKLFGRKSSGS